MHLTGYKCESEMRCLAEKEKKYAKCEREMVLSDAYVLER